MAKDTLFDFKLFDVDDVNGSKFPMIISSGKFQRRVIYMKY